MGVVSLDNLRATTEIPNQIARPGMSRRRHSPLEIATSLVLLLTAYSTEEAQNHPSESASSFPRSSKNE